MPNFDLSGKVALVTGAGRGLGRGMALALAEAGADVVATSRSEPEIGDTTASLAGLGGNPLPLPWDLSDVERIPTLVDRVVAERGKVDVLVHAAGTQIRRPAYDLTVAEWDEVQRVNLVSGFALSKAVGADMMERDGGGKIIYIASLTTRIGIRGTAAYGASKSGLVSLMRTLAVEWAPHRICVNAIAPGYFHTRLNDELFRDPERREWILGRIPMGRPGSPEDLAGAVVFLASPASDYVTGQALGVDGGWLAG
ncbi:MAG: SDR family NAD(P)-dependent oxidoreductase [Streptosporangiaceae bacterium]